MWMVPGLSQAGIVWRGDFETGNRSQYSGEQMVNSNRLQVVTSPVAEGKYALKATVYQGDDPINSSGNRNELFYKGNEAVGSEYYYRWKVMFPADFPSVNAWQLFTQWHHDGCCGSPPVEFFVKGEQIRLSLNGGAATPWTTTLKRGVWQEFIFHVKWSADASVGFVELWHNKEKVLAKKYISTMYSGQRNYLKLGLYRDDSISPQGVVYHDGFIQATTLEDVLPAAPAPVDAGTPVVDAGTQTPGPVDSGTPVVDAGTPQPDPDPGQVDPEPTDAGTVDPAPVFDAGTGGPGSWSGVGGGVPVGGDSAGEPGGCSSTRGAPFAAFALLALVGLVRGRRRM